MDLFENGRLIQKKVSDFHWRSGPVPLLQRILLCCASLMMCSTLAFPEQSGKVCIVITGLGGMPEYEDNFSIWADEMEQLFGQKLGHSVYRLDGHNKKREDILQVFSQVASANHSDELWLFLIGHANHDGRNYRFNIAGPDLTDADMKSFLDRLAHAKTYLIAATSVSGTLAGQLSGANRVIVTATKSQSERQPPRFMSFFVEAVASAQADVNKDGRLSLLETFRFARKRVAKWYEEKGRIQTEHSILDDNGKVRLIDSQGTTEKDAAGHGTLMASRAYLSAPVELAYDSPAASRLGTEKLSLERAIDDLKFRKDEIPVDEYYQALEKLLLDLATINERIAQLGSEE